MWDKLKWMYEVVRDGHSPKITLDFDIYKLTVYSMGENNPVIRIDIKEVKNGSK